MIEKNLPPWARECLAWIEDSPAGKRGYNAFLSGVPFEQAPHQGKLKPKLMDIRRQATRRITLDVRPGNEIQALGLVEHFVRHYPDHFRDSHPERHGVGYKPSESVYFVYGNDRHIRVKEDIDDDQGSDDSVYSGDRQS